MGRVANIGEIGNVYKIYSEILMVKYLLET
jgi:hypothetical protein